jgi:transposase
VSDRAIIELVKTDANARRLMSVPGIGPITASAIAASVQDIRGLLFVAAAHC